MSKPVKEGLFKTEPEQEKLITRTYTIDPGLYEQFKKCADKDCRTMSTIIRASLRKYVESRT
jgi:predicted transcriptional regulator